MLGALRGVARTPIALVFILLLAASFAVWGLSDIFAGRPSGALASAGNRHLYQADLERRIGYYLQNERSQGNYTDRRSAAQDGTVQQIFSSMAQNMALLEHADASGLAASKRGIAKRIAASGGFGDPVTGQFNQESYRQFLQNSADSQEGFETALRDDMTMEYLNDVPEMAVLPPEGLLRLWMLPYIENRMFAYAVVPESKDIPEPDPEQIQNWYDDNSDQYITPERRELAVFSLSADDYLHTIDVSEDDIMAAYDRDGDNYAGSQQRELIEASSAARKPIELLVDRLNTGTGVDEAFDGLDQIIRSPRTVSEDSIDDDQTIKDVFNLPEGGALFPVQDEDTGLWETTIVKRIAPADIPPLEEIREQLINDIQRQRANDAFTNDRSEILIDLTGGGYPVDEIAAELGGVVNSYPAVSSDGQTAEDYSIEALDPEILEVAFNLAEGETSTEIDSAQTVRIVQVTKIIPTGIMPLEEVRERIRNSIVASQKEDSALLVARSIAEQSQDLESLESAAAETGLKIHVHDQQVSRYGNNGELDSQVVDAVFKLKPQQADVLHRPSGAALVMILTEVILDDDDQNLVDQYMQIGKSSLASSLGSQISSATRQIIEQRIPVQIDYRALDEYTNFLLGQSAQ